jgi:oxygen-independent coproporphyrinogen-3 oxidase
MKTTLERVNALSPNRVSVFGYAHVPWMKSHQKMIKKSPLPSAEERFDLHLAISSFLKEEGYQQIGIDHFAKPDDDMAVAYKTQKLHRNFQGYTTDKAKDLIGIGASSIGKIGNIYVQNTSDILAYQKLVHGGNLPTVRGVRLMLEDRRRAEIIQNIMCYFKADIPQDIMTDAMDNLSPYFEDGIISVRGECLFIVNEKTAPLYARLIAACFDQYLPSSRGRHAQAV